MDEDSMLSSPGVRFPPPLLFVAGIVSGWVLERAVRSLPITRASGAGSTAGGVALIVAGAALVAWGMLTFRAARTAIIPSRSASRIVTSGPYRFTRNPMYVGFTLAYCGAALLVNSLWPVMLLPIVLMLLVRLVIRREEAYLANAFREEYALYRTQVRRWL